MGISELVRQNASTYYFFQNPAANARDYEEFELNEREMGFVLGQTKPARATNRAILVKRPQTRESVILDIDLSGLGPLVRLFSSQSTDVKMVSDLQRQFGEGWVKHYIAAEAP